MITARRYEARPFHPEIDEELSRFVGRELPGQPESVVCANPVFRPQD